jgi:hypothetical protein
MNEWERQKNWDHSVPLGVNRKDSKRHRHRRHQKYPAFAAGLHIRCWFLELKDNQQVVEEEKALHKTSVPLPLLHHKDSNLVEVEHRTDSHLGPHKDLRSAARHTNSPAAAEVELHRDCCIQATAVHHMDRCSPWASEVLPVASRMGWAREGPHMDWAREGPRMGWTREGPRMDFPPASRRDCGWHPKVAAHRTHDTVEVVHHRKARKVQNAAVALQVEPPLSLSQIDQKDST